MPETKLKLDVSSSSFRDGEPIPSLNTAYGDNVSPDIRWGDVPAGCKSIALICEDPDAPREPSFVHWLIADIPPSMRTIPAAVSHEPRPAVLEGGTQGTNDKGHTGYFGPRPPSGTGVHHYHFHVLALDKMLHLPDVFDRDQFQEAIRESVIAQGAVVGTCEAPGSAQV